MKKEMINSMMRKALHANMHVCLAVNLKDVIVLGVETAPMKIDKILDKRPHLIAGFYDENFQIAEVIEDLRATGWEEEEGADLRLTGLPFMGSGTSGCRPACS